MVRVVVCISMLLVSSGTIYAQDDETPLLTPGQYTYIPGGLVEVECYGSSSYDPVEEYEVLDITTLVVLPDGRFLSVWEGADFLFTPAEDNSYTVQLLEVDPPYTYEGTMNIVSLEEFHMATVMTVNASCIYTYDLRFGLVDGEAMPSVWTESEREFRDISFFNECLGRSDAEPGGAWANPDILVPILRTDDGLLIGASEYIGEGDTYIYEATEEANGNSLYTRITLTNVFGDEYTKEIFAQLDGRADCQVISTSTIVPFYGDIDALLEGMGVTIEE